MEATLYVAGHAPPGCPGPRPACATLAAALGERYDAVYSIFGWMPLVAPALIGAFWGAPLLGREYERGTHRLAWTQAVPVWRWLAVKLSLLGGAVVAGGLLLSLMVSLWRPVFRAGIDSSFGNVGVFNMVGVAPAAWWLYAFALGTLAGTVLRRTHARDGAGRRGGGGDHVHAVRAERALRDPERVVLSDTTVLADPDARLVGATWVDPSGREIDSPGAEVCPRRVDAGRSNRNTEAWQKCLFGKGYGYAVSYHPPHDVLALPVDGGGHPAARLRRDGRPGRAAHPPPHGLATRTRASR